MEPSWRDERDSSLPTSLVARTRRIEPVAPEAAVSRLEEPRFVWTGASRGLIAAGEVHELTANGPERMATVREAGEDLLGRVQRPADAPAVARPRLYGGFGFHGAEPGAGWDGYRPAQFTLPALQVATTDDGTWLTAMAAGADAGECAADRLERWARRLDGVASGDSTVPAIRSSRPLQSREAWIERVAGAVDRIRDGGLQKVVLAAALDVELEGAPSIAAALARLRDRYPDCFRYAVDPSPGSTLFGATPERLVTVRGDALETEALAGTDRRGTDSASDDERVAAFRDSEKDAHEHALVVRAIRDQLRSRVRSLSIGDRRVRTLSNVHHLETPIRATVDPDRHVLEFVEALHPTPAVGGLPPDAALATIRETEAFDRGWYAAPIGWFDAAGDGSFAVAIRAALADGDRLRTFAGAGIVADSDPAAEWDEINAKYRPILEVFE